MTRSGLKISGNEGWLLLRAQTSALLKQCWTERNKRQPTSKEELWIVLQKTGRTIFQRLLQRVQAVWKNKGVHTKYWLSSSLELHKFSFGLIYIYIVYMMFSHFSKLLHPFPVFLALYKELRSGSTPLWSTGNTRQGLPWWVSVWKRLQTEEQIQFFLIWSFSNQFCGIQLTFRLCF